MKKLTRTTEGLRDMLFDEIENFLDGKVTETHAKAVTTITNSILKTVVIDLEAKKMVERMNAEKGQNKVISDLNLNLLLTKKEA